MTETLFDLPPGAVVEREPVEKLSPNKRRLILHRRRIAAGLHPLAGVSDGLRLHPDAPRDKDGPGPRCGDCVWRMASEHYMGKSFPKCMVHDGIRATRSEASDCRAWWPACVNYEAVSDG